MSNDQHKQRVQSYFQESAATVQRAATACMDSILDATEILKAAFRSGNKLLLCGNGGSAADCQHMAAECVSRLTKDVDRPALPAIALTTDTSFLTAHANDDGFKSIFSRQIEAVGTSGDVLLAISTSGNSENILRAIEEAKTKDMRTIALTGEGGKLAKAVDVAIAVPSSDTQHIQEVHLLIEHIICTLIEYDLFGKDS